MSETSDKPKLGTRAPLGIKRTIETGKVKQSFSHGRSNTVVVEVKKRRILGRPGEAEAPPFLDLDHDGVRPAVAEALLHLARLDRALEAKRRSRSQSRLVRRFAHIILRSHPRPQHPAHPPSRHLAQQEGRKNLPQVR